MADPRSIFTNYFRKERDRCEQALADILDILTDDQKSPIDQNEAILLRLESHWQR